MKKNNDFKQINRYRRVMLKKIADRSVEAPALLSANTEILRLAQQMRTGGDEQLQTAGVPEVITVY